MAYKAKGRKEIAAKAMGLPCNSNLKVCKAFFLLHLVSLKEPLHWLNRDTIDHDEQVADPPTTSPPKSGKNAKLETAVTDFLKDWLKDLPTVDSHYCRRTATYKDKKFLHPGTTISQLHREYQQGAATAEVRAVGIQHFTHVCKTKQNIQHVSNLINQMGSCVTKWVRNQPRIANHPKSDNETKQVGKQSTICICCYFWTSWRTGAIRGSAKRGHCERELSHL